MNKWTPARTFGLFEQGHVDFMRKAVAFAGVARNAGTNDIFPCCLPAALTRKNVVEIEVLAVQSFGAVLAGVVVPLVNVLPGEFDFLTGQTVELAKDNDGGNPDHEAHGLDHFGGRFRLRKIMPSGKVVGEIVVVLVAPDYEGVLLVEQSKGATDATDVDRLPQPVEY